MPPQATAVPFTLAVLVKQAAASAEFLSTNSAEGTGGALYGSGHYDVYADFIGNTAEEGGAVYGWGAIGSLNGNFINNSSTGRGGAIWKDHGSVENLTGDFINNHSDAIAGAIGVDQAEFNNITGNFINNSSAIAGAILNTPNSVIGSINGSFYGNASIDNGIETGMPGTAGGAIINIAQIGNINGDFSGNYAKAENTGGGAIFNVGLIGDLTGNFVGNYAEGEKRPPAEQLPILAFWECLSAPTLLLPLRLTAVLRTTARKQPTALLPAGQLPPLSATRLRLTENP